MKPSTDRRHVESDDGPRRACLLVFSKLPRPGRVKTRLIGDLTAVEAAELHAAFLADLIDEMQQGAFDLRIAWALSEDEVLPKESVEAVTQVGADLGERLHHALATAAERYLSVAAVGSDHPELTASLVEEAFDKLARGTDLVLGPSADGGYYLIGFRRDSIDPTVLSDIPWSSDRVLSATITAARARGLLIELLPEVGDVDTPADLESLVRRLGQDPERVGRRTRAVLETLNLLASPRGRGDNHESS